MEHDNLSNLYNKFKLFCSEKKEFKHLLDKFNFQDSTILNLNEVIDCLGSIFLEPAYTLLVLTYFRRELLNILLNVSHFGEASASFNYESHIKVCLALAKVITQHPDVESFAVGYFQKYPAPFEQYGSSNTYPARKKLKVEDSKLEFTDLDIVSACYVFLCCKTDFFKNKWSWATFIKKYYNHSEDMVKWKCLQCVRIVTGMNEAQFSKLLKQSLTEDSLNKCIIEHERSVSKEDSVQVFETEEEFQVSSEISKSVVFVGSVYLPIFKAQKKEVEFLPVESTKTNLHKVALGIAANKAVCLQGPVGSGKTFLIEYLASITGRVLGDTFIKVQLSDQTDSKMLLGTYRCTDIPGEFVWQPGVLTQAVMEGNWLLLEDIDLASMDIASVLTALLENGCLTVPGYRDSLPITPGFQLFLTQRLLPSATGFHKKQSNVITLLEKNVLQINIIPLTISELELIIQTIYLALKTIANRMVDTFLLFSSNGPRSGRLVSTRDLFKWCRRSALNFDVTSQQSALNVLQNAIDIFCCAYPNNEDRLSLGGEICSRLGIISEKADYYCNRYKPEMSLTSNSLKSSRVEVQKRSAMSDNRMNFCFTRPAVCLLERIMCGVNMKEPVLLVGETGTGKTLAVQYLAHTIGVKLIVINMNQQSDSADLLGGYKPVDLKFVIAPIKREFEEVFCAYYNVTENKKFLSNVNHCFNNSKWNILIMLMQKSLETAVKRLTGAKEILPVGKKRKNPNLDKQSKINERNQHFLQKWLQLGTKLQKLEVQIKHKNSLAFSFIEGSLVKAVANGYWVLLDEINLANAETLECLSGLLEGNDGSISLLERGDKTPIKRHPQFTLFACMNPSTDVGKRDLPTGLRNRFTELYMDELTHKNDLILLVNNYLTAMSLPQEKLENIVKFYLAIKKEAELNLCDGIGQKPHFSLRTLCRALTIASRNPCGIFNRSLYEAFCLSFLTQLDSKSYQLVESLIAKYILGNAKNANSVLKQAITQPQADKSSRGYLEFEGYWISIGNSKPEVPNNYILTKSVRRNLKDLVRVVSIGKSPVLLQGDTSVGKTSLIKYLAKSSGNKCVRINNHEHTDLQEYIGSYVADVTGKLIFKEGLLVEAMRQGHWIILDELNLAPTDVLEALNRVLDDNRELFIPETQDTIKAHPNFMLFATQNPPGLYGGRKVLSRAFRNRFVELHFNEIPSDELEFILHMRCEMSPSYAKKMVAVMIDLQTRRRGSAAFAGKHGFITLRDLFRWGERYRLATGQPKLYDWDQHLADEGYLLLAGRVRKVKEREEIVDVLQKHMKRQVLPSNLFTLCKTTSTVTRHILERFHANKDVDKNIVWTYNMCQLGVLVAKSLEFREPVLLVGETGGGKTTICKLIAEINKQSLLTVNCHMHTESSDFIGGLRPVREHSQEDLNRLFEWVDGPLIQAMIKGDVFLADEISLADDSVLERLNSLLEPERLLLLAEKGSDMDNTPLISAHENFHFVGTMNPGGDHGKKELSLALRNRFTEIWCESCTERDDLIDIIEHNLAHGVCFGNQEDGRSGIGRNVMNFIEWFSKTQIGKRFTISIRDILTWVNFINACFDKINVADAYLHGACLTFLDSLGSGVTSTESSTALESFRSTCLNFIVQQLASSNLEASSMGNLSVKISEETFSIKPFYLEMGTYPTSDNNFTYEAPTCMYNILRLLRGLQLSKAILLEGSPGVGKTSMVTALAKSTRNNLLRINLSDQTDISDLFGADLPVEGGKGGQFAWRDGPFLQALKKGYWILLDELNLASQSVLEGLNACLDHRGEVFIPELGKTFYIKPGTRLFASQNPLKQGGSRRGLPQSFLNRFTEVYIEPLTETDLLFILTAQFSSMPKSTICKMVEFNSKIVAELESHIFGHRGSPWEFNLRDLTRWCEAVIKENRAAENLVQLIYCDRMRTLDDKVKMRTIFEEVFECKMGGVAPTVHVTESEVYLGDVCLKRETSGVNLSVVKQERTCLVLRTQVAVLRSLAYCVNFNWMAILVGCSGSGKSSVVRTLANLVGKTLHTLPVTSAMDTTDILGGFEQLDYTRHFEEIIRKTEVLLLEIVQECAINGDPEEGGKILQMWENFVIFQRTDSENRTMVEETQTFLERLQALEKIWAVLSSCNFTPVNVKKQIQIFNDKGKVISQVVRKEGNLNAGGKFEWVDSILIKCLQEGSWLLIDNVNLCSPAVLDRLNALLEPNGVLTIGERGVKANGEMVEIKPHKDFRLFLTMDPKNGEISRAMRNRGIEIYMLSESEQGTRDEYDAKSLISQAGLKEDRYIDTLLSMHGFLQNYILGEKPNVNSLLQASFLISQELLRGRNVFRAFLDALIDVYYKSRSSNEFDETFSLDLLNHDLKTRLGLENTVLSIFKLYNDDVTVKTDSLAYQSQVEQIKQQSVVVAKRNLPASVFSHALINFYTLTSKMDLKTRFLFAQEILQTAKAKDQSAAFCEIMGALESEDSSSLPYDPHWIPDRVQDKKFRANRIYLLLYFTSFQKTDSNPTLDKKQDVLTLKQLLNGVRKKLIEPRTNDVLEVRLLDVLDTFDGHLSGCLKHERMNISDEHVIQAMSLLRWRFILEDLLNVNVKQTNWPEYKALFANIHVHYNWFLKFTIKELFGILSCSSSSKLEALILDISASEPRDDMMALKKFAKIFKKNNDSPPPLINLVQLEVFKKFQEVAQRHDVYKKGCDLNVVRDSNWQFCMTITRKCLTYDFTDEPEMIDDLVSFKPKEWSKTNLEISPLLDYIARFEVLRLTYDLSSVGRNNDVLGVLTVPCQLRGALSQYDENTDARQLHGLRTHLFMHLLKSAALNPHLFYPREEDSSPKESYALFSPLLSILLTKYFVCGPESKEVVKTVTLGDFDLKQSYGKVKSLFANNLHEIQSQRYDYVLCEKRYLERRFTELINKIALCLNMEQNFSDVSVSVLCIRQLEAICHEKGQNDNVIVILLEKCLQAINNLELETCLDESLKNISDTYILLNYLKALLNSNLPLIDPLIKAKLKKEYCEEEIKEFTDSRWSYQLQNDVFSCSENTLHSYVAQMEDKIAQLNIKLHEFGKYVAVRPTDVTYFAVIKEILHHFSVILSPKQILKLHSSLNVQFEALQSALKASSTVFEIGTCEKLASECHQNISSYEELIKVLENHRYNYPDIIEPLLNNLVEFLYGFRLKTDLHWKLINQYKNSLEQIDLNSFLVKFFKFPVLGPSLQNSLEVINSYTNLTWQNFVVKSLDSEENEYFAKQENFKLLKCGIHELSNLLLLIGQNCKNLNRKLFKSFDSLLAVFVAAWKKQEEEREAKKKEEESLYKMKNKTEEEEVEDHFKDLFPSFHDQDFSDMQEQMLGDTQEDLTPPTSYVGTITNDDVRFVAYLHQELLKLYTRTEWLNPEPKAQPVDFVTPLVLKFKLLKALLKKYGKYLDYTIDKEILGSLHILVGVANDFGEVSSSDLNPKRNFYKDSNIDAIKQSFNVLSDILTQVKQYLSRWSDHPSLKTIETLVERILAFDIRSPVPRFLTGFEILLTKIFEWEQVASTECSLSPRIQEITDQIITWRNIEMSVWSDSLNDAFERMNNPLQKWWFYLYEVMMQYIFETESNVEALISTLQKFVTGSNLAEFAGRLNLLLAFHRHALNLEKSERTDQFICILWNVHEYFKQFIPNVEAKIKELRSPIEKKLKDYIKIVKWKDVSYWAVKETLHKTHKTLHKHIKEFEIVLNNPATPCLVNTTSDTSNSVGIWDRPQRQSPKKYHYTKAPETYMAKLRLSKMVENAQSDQPILSKCENYFLKSRRLCKKTIEASSYPMLIQSVDGFVTEIIENSTRLQGLEVDQSLPKNKQKKQAKGILQQKRKALSDLFKALAEIGLSFRTGIMHSKIKKCFEQFLIKPVDLKAAFGHLSHGKDEKLLTIWEGCEMYFVKSLLRLDSLESALVSPAQDLGMQNAERCRGFSEHLVKIMLDQKSSLVKTSRILHYLKFYSYCIVAHCDESALIPVELYCKIQEILKNVVILMEQYKVIVVYSSSDNFDDVPKLNKDATRNELLQNNYLLERILNSTKKLITHVSKFDSKIPTADFEFAAPATIPISNLELVVQDLKTLSMDLSCYHNCVSYVFKTPSLDWLIREVTSVTVQFETKIEPQGQVESSKFRRQVEKFLEKVLIIVQNVYKKYKEMPDQEQPSDDAGSELKPNHLKTLILEHLFDDLSILEMEDVLKDLHKLVKVFYATNSKSVFAPIIPFLNQLILLYEYFVTQQVSTYRVTCKMTSVLLNIFLELATKGFCIPPEFSDELTSDAEGQNLVGGGTGLGEGEGQKDVSDKIESEDQLEDAQPIDKEKEDKEDADCKEEDKGIEMSEDFDSKLQDVEKGDDDEDHSDSDKDADEQMGETDKNADKLDKEIWGSDNEDAEENENEEEKGEEQGQGEKQGENELSAKENESKEQDQTDPSGEEAKEKNKKEINEMEDPEIDDQQIDPYHGNHPEYPEPEAMDLPEDLDIDDDMEEKDEQQDETNPFDIDAMKEQNLPEDKVNEDGVKEPEVEDSEDREGGDDQEEAGVGENGDKENEEDPENDQQAEEEQRPTDKKKDEENTDDSNIEEKPGFDQTHQNEDNAQPMDVDDVEAADNVQSNPSKNQKQNQSSEACQEDNPDKKGVGESHMEESKSGHTGRADVRQDISSGRDKNEKETRRKPGESDSKRSLGDASQSVKKKLKTMDVQQGEQDAEEDDLKQETEMYQHIKEAKDSDQQVLDTATKEQAEQQQFGELKEDEPKESSDLVPEEEDEPEEPNETSELKAEKVDSERKKASEKGQHPDGDILENLPDAEIEGDVVETSTAARGGETTHHTLYSNLSGASVAPLSIKEMIQIRAEVEQQLSVWNEPPTTKDAEQTWEKISSLTSSLAQGLSEQLRLVLEPTQASRLKGDYRTGKRINMRKVIPYIASEFRKDKIWLRRTKPSKRDYLIALAIDDSSSMSDNHSKELAFESVALISKALTLLESGQLSVLSFGESTEVLHKLTDTFTDKSGVKLLQKFNFCQKKTCVAKLVEFASEMLSSAHSSASSLIAKLLIIVSDGRGIFSEGDTYVQQAVRRAKLLNIFMVFVIIDNPENKDSILDIRMPMFKDGKLLGIKSYMDAFPFPFYIILRDINSLPNVLSDALRQWFEIVATGDQ